MSKTGQSNKGLVESQNLSNKGKNDNTGSHEKIISKQNTNSKISTENNKTGEGIQINENDINVS